MQSSPDYASASIPGEAELKNRSVQPADLIYQTGTIFAMLLVLVSLWVF